MLTIDFPKKSCQTKTQGRSPGRKKTFWKCSSMETNTHCLCWMAVSACILSQSQFSCTSCWVHFQPVLTLILTGDSAGGQVPGDSKPKEGGTKGKGGVLKGDVAQRRGSCYQNWGHRSSKVLFKEGLALKGRTQFGCLKSSRAFGRILAAMRYPLIWLYGYFGAWLVRPKYPCPSGPCGWLIDWSEMLTFPERGRCFFSQGFMSGLKINYGKVKVKQSSNWL